jgi:hypothetical protein
MAKRNNVTTHAMDHTSTRKKKKRNLKSPAKGQREKEKKRSKTSPQDLASLCEALHAEASQALEELNLFEASEKWTSLIDKASAGQRNAERGGRGEKPSNCVSDGLLVDALKGRLQVSLKLKCFERAVEDGQKLVALAGDQDVSCHLLLGRALFFHALRVRPGTIT